MREYRLNNWGVTYLSDSPFIPPECNPTCLSGYREGEDRPVRTSPIVEVNGRIVRTESGSTYFLGEPSPEYLAYLEKIGYPYDPDQPIKDKRS